MYQQQKWAFLLEAIHGGLMAAVNFLETVKYALAKVGIVSVFFYQQAVGVNVSALCNMRGNDQYNFL